MVLICDACRQDISLGGNVNPSICLFPCFHKYCERCKAQVLSTARPQHGAESRVSCKLCNQHFLLNVLYDYSENQIEKIFCLHCNIKNKATVEWRCKSCQDRYLCAHCSQPHYHSGHELEPVMKPNIPLRSQCSVHSNILATYLCSCQARLCDYCLNEHADGQTTHPHEQRFAYTQLAEKARTDLDSIRHQSQRDFEKLERLKEKITKNKEQISIQASQARTSIANEIVELVNAIIRRGNDIVTCIDLAEETKQKSCVQLEQEMRHWTDRLRKIESFTENALLTVQQDHPGMWSASMFAQSALWQVNKRKDLAKNTLETFERLPLIKYQHGQSNIDLANAIRSFGLINLDGEIKIPTQCTPLNAQMFSISNQQPNGPSTSTEIQAVQNKKSNPPPTQNVTPIIRSTTLLKDSTSNSGINNIQQQQQQRVGAVPAYANFNLSSITPTIPQIPISSQNNSSSSTQQSELLLGSSPPNNSGLIPHLLQNNNNQINVQTSSTTRIQPIIQTQQRPQILPTTCPINNNNNNIVGSPVSLPNTPLTPVIPDQMHIIRHNAMAAMAFQQQQQMMNQQQQQNQQQIRYQQIQQQQKQFQQQQQIRMPLQQHPLLMPQQSSQQNICLPQNQALFVQQQQQHQQMVHQQQQQQMQHQQQLQQHLAAQRQQQHMLIAQQQYLPPILSPPFHQQQQHQVVQILDSPNQQHQQQMLNISDERPPQIMLRIPNARQQNNNNNNAQQFVDSIIGSTINSQIASSSSTAAVVNSCGIPTSIEQIRKDLIEGFPGVISDHQPPIISSKQPSTKSIPEVVELLDDDEEEGNKAEQSTSNNDTDNINLNQQQDSLQNNPHLVKALRQNNKPQSVAADSTVGNQASNESPPIIPQLNNNIIVGCIGIKRKPEIANIDDIENKPTTEKRLAKEICCNNNLNVNEEVEKEEEKGKNKRIKNVSPPSDLISTTTAENGEVVEEEVQEVLDDEQRGKDDNQEHKTQKINRKSSTPNNLLKHYEESSSTKSNSKTGGKWANAKPNNKDKDEKESSSTSSSTTKNKIKDDDNIGKEVGELVERIKNDAKKAEERASTDDWDDYCYVCSQGCDESTGSLGCCASCPHVYHARCHVPKIFGLMEDLPDDWRCSLCISCEPLTQQTQEFGDREQLLCSKVFLACFKDNNSVELFINQVPPTETDYHQVIKHPIWLQAIAEKINLRSYTNVTKFLDDMNLLFRNFSTFNSPHVPLASKGKNVYSKYMEAVKKYMPYYSKYIWIYVSLYNTRFNFNNTSTTSTSSSSSTLNLPPLDENENNRSILLKNGKKRGGSKAKSQTPA